MTTSVAPMRSPSLFHAVFYAVRDLAFFYSCLFAFIVRGLPFSRCPHFEDSKRTRVHIYSLALIFELWHQPHYRNGTYQEDMHKNLRNVAIPGTGVPLSVFCANRFTMLLFVAVIYPLVSLFSAINVGRFDITCIGDSFREQLLSPRDWFSFWRLNCTLATYHSSKTQEQEYQLEDKLAFLQSAEAKGVAVSPILHFPGIVAKHRNEEGGLGYKSFTNALSGGDWIIQETLTNSTHLAQWLPKRAPLSTFRIITASTGGIAAESQNPNIQALSCVWRAGRAGAATDHSSVLFDINANGTFGKATTNAHWYQLGMSKCLTTPWTSDHSMTTHPDTGKQITGERLTSPTVKQMMAFACEAHLKMMPRVPMSGWDVALTNKGMLLLECNLSCNFFRGQFDEAAYFDFVHSYFTDLEKINNSNSGSKGSGKNSSNMSNGNGVNHRSRR